MSLKQALEYINDGKVFVIHTTSAMRAFTKDIKNLDLDKQDVYYYDCNYLPGLLGEGEWECYLTQPKENSEIIDKELRERIIKQKTIPNKSYFTST